MHDGDLGPDVDIKIPFPDEGVIRIESATLFGDAGGSLYRRFLGLAFLASEINSAIIGPAPTEGVMPAVELRFAATRYGRRQVLDQVAALLDAALACIAGVFALGRRHRRIRTDQ
jgi:hypothetical protein